MMTDAPVTTTTGSPESTQPTGNTSQAGNNGSGPDTISMESYKQLQRLINQKDAEIAAMRSREEQAKKDQETVMAKLTQFERDMLLFQTRANQVEEERVKFKNEAEAKAAEMQREKQRLDALTETLKAELPPEVKAAVARAYVENPDLPPTASKALSEIALQAAKAREEALMRGVTPGFQIPGSQGAAAPQPGSHQEWQAKVNALPYTSEERKQAEQAYLAWAKTQP